MNTTDVKSDPKLDQEQVKSIEKELARIYELYDELMKSDPLSY